MGVYVPQLVPKMARPKQGSTVYYGWPGATMTNAESTFAYTANRDYVHPFIVYRPITITEVDIVTTVNQSGKTCYIAIYSLDGDMQPAALQGSQSTLSLTTAGTLTWSPNVTLPIGWYGLLLNFDAAGAAPRYWWTNLGLFLTALDGTSMIDGLYKTRTAGAFSSPTWDTPNTITPSNAAPGFFSMGLMKWTPL